MLEFSIWIYTISVLELYSLMELGEIDVLNVPETWNIAVLF